MAQPQPAYPPPPPPGYAAPAYGAPVGYGPPQPTNTVVVAAPPVVVREKPRVNHLLHCIITIFFFPWAIVWLILCMTESTQSHH